LKTKLKKEGSELSEKIGHLKMKTKINETKPFMQICDSKN